MGACDAPGVGGLVSLLRGESLLVWADDMRVQSLANAGILVETSAGRVLCDPWFTDGAYQGAWAMWPKPLEDPVRALGKVKAIYVSHIHPDHYDRTFLRAYLQHYGQVPILCGRRDLTQAVQADGFASARFVEGDDWLGGDVSLCLVPNYHRTWPMDTALGIRDGTETLLHMNDNPLDPTQLRRLQQFCHGTPTVAYLPFTGGSSYPQRYVFDTPALQAQAARAKQATGMARFAAYCEWLQPVMAVPSAGEYWLQGPLAVYNHLRGQTDATAVVAAHPGVAVVPAAGQWLDVTRGQVTAARTVPYVEPDMREAPPYAYVHDQDWWSYTDQHPVRLAEAAWQAACRRAPEQPTPWTYCVAWEDRWIVATLGLAGQLTIEQDVQDRVPRMELTADLRYLIGLWLGRYHWGDADISSHVETRRVPDRYDAEAYDALAQWTL